MREARGLGVWFARRLTALNPWRALAQAEAEARRAEQRLREALDALPEGVVFLDAEGRYVLWNKAYAEIYHRSADLFRVGRQLAETLRIGVERGDYPAAVGREEAWLAERLALLKNPTAERHEQQIRDGRWVMIEERQTADGGVIGLRIDITEMKAQATALEAALAQAQAARRAKAEFLANMSHELRTPLNGVIGLAEALARTPLDEGQNTLVAELISSAGRLNGLLGDLFDFNSLEAGKVEIAGLAFEPADLVRRTAAPFAAAAGAKGLAFEIEVANAEGQALGDPDRLAQIIEQLLSNAVKFTDAGKITVRLAAEEAAEGPVLVVDVIDTGRGFDEGQAERLFGGFEMGDASPTREHGGVGLGLAICQRLASLMGARIEAHGSPGRGARFRLSLPFARPPALPSPDRALKVLLADDNPTNRRVVELILDAVGAEVVSVENGAEAAHAARQEDFDLVLMDLMMPVMDGLAAIREIRKTEAEAGRPRRPIIVLSANSGPDDLAASRTAGADGHLGKPIRAEVLLTAVAQALGDD
ncbi:MAG: response regulator [Caulobacteraceae bacterium]|nr:response regulator [Caulobacteraceae bacterium]